MKRDRGHARDGEKENETVEEGNRQKQKAGTDVSSDRRIVRCHGRRRAHSVAAAILTPFRPWAPLREERTGTFVRATNQRDAAACRRRASQTKSTRSVQREKPQARRRRPTCTCRANEKIAPRQTNARVPLSWRSPSLSFSPCALRNPGRLAVCRKERVCTASLMSGLSRVRGRRGLECEDRDAQNRHSSGRKLGVFFKTTVLYRAPLNSKPLAFLSACLYCPSFDSAKRFEQKVQEFWKKKFTYTTFRN